MQVKLYLNGLINLRYCNHTFFTTGSDFLMAGGVIFSYFFADRHISVMQFSPEKVCAYVKGKPVLPGYLLFHFAEQLYLLSVKLRRDGRIHG